MKPEHPSFSLKSRFKSVSYALSGISFALKTQHNARIHVIAAVIVCTAGLVLNVSAQDWRWLVVAIMLVWFAELMNTAFEYLCDLISPEFNDSVKKAKDIAAGAVLVCAVGAAVIGTLTFKPYIF